MPDESTHALQVGDPLDEDRPLFIPFSLSGVTSHFPVRKPTAAEWEDEEHYPRIELTADEPAWDPSAPDFGDQEDSMTDFRGQVIA